MDNPNCHQGTAPGTPNGILTIIIIGELKGMILPQKAIGPVGSFIASRHHYNRKNNEHGNGKTE